MIVTQDEIEEKISKAISNNDLEEINKLKKDYPEKTYKIASMFMTWRSMLKSDFKYELKRQHIFKKDSDVTLEKDILRKMKRLNSSEFVLAFKIINDFEKEVE